MDASPELGVVAADNAAPPQVRARPTPTRPAVGLHSLKELVEQAVADAEAQAIRRAPAMTKGNKSLAARILQTNYTTLHAKMKRSKISAEEFFPS
jgi:two-component system nitrogen regulation response regulator GlnG